MYEIFTILLPVATISAWAYGIGFMSGCEQTKEIYDPTIRQSDLDKVKKI